MAAHSFPCLCTVDPPSPSSLPGLSPAPPPADHILSISWSTAPISARQPRPFSSQRRLRLSPPLHRAALVPSALPTGASSGRPSSSGVSGGDVNGGRQSCGVEDPGWVGDGELRVDPAAVRTGDKVLGDREEARESVYVKAPLDATVSNAAPNDR